MVAQPRNIDSRVYDAIYSIPGGAPGYDRYFQLASRVRHASNPLEYLAQHSDAIWGVQRSLKSCGAKSVLEAGCGLGYLVYALRQAGYDAEGIDISEAAIKQAQSEYGDFYRAESVESHASSSSKKYDCIVMVEVIEHLEEPIAFLRSSLCLLNPGGAIIVTTPNRSYVDYAEPWSTDLPPVHLWWFSEDSLRQIADRIETGIAFVDFADYNKRFPIFQTYRVKHQSVLDESGEVIRKEHVPLAILRRLGILHDTYWWLSRIAGLARTTGSHRRQTMVARLFTP
jgi:SAM-dependent methyltransferase